MLAQATPFTETTAALIAALVAAGPLAVAVTKVVDFLRGLIDKADKMPGWTWNVLALVIGVAMCLGWGLNVMGGLVASVPALAESDALAGTAGSVLTGLFIGAMAGFWHDKMHQWAATAREADAATPAPASAPAPRAEKVMGK